MAAMTSTSTLYFDSDLHPDDTLCAFDEFIQSFELRYDAQNPDPPKTSLDAAIERWKLANDDKKSKLDDYDNIRDEWRSKDRVTKLLGTFSSKRLFADWKVAEPDDSKRAKVTWKYFVTTMQQHYKPTENLTLKNHQFRSLAQDAHESFPTFCVYKAVQHCNFKCHNDDCTAEDTAICDQIIIGSTHDKIREEALKNSWDLQQLRKEGMRIESATKGLEELNNENPVNKMGKYSFKNMKKKPEAGKPRSCYYCGQDIKTSVIANLKSCRARTSKCNFRDAIGHYKTVCRKKKAINELKNYSEQQAHQIEDHDHSGVYSINIFRITETPQQQPPHK
ncbi:Hypothetical predicted protein [Paramuricea clavata]|nr:Hypothetical predicted protein [Paramuricea clavata]